MNSLRTCLLAGLAASALTAGAEVKREYQMLNPLPGSRYAEECSVAGGFALSGREKDQPYSTDGYSVQYRCASASIGMGVSEYREKEYSIGDYLTDIPEGEIDWGRTLTLTKASGLGKGVFFVPADDEVNLADTNRLFFTICGTQRILWARKNDAAVETNAYSVAQSTTPHRLYWTEPPFNAAAVMLPSVTWGYELQGDPAIVSATRPTDCSTNQWKGVVIDATTYSVRAFVQTVVADGTVSYTGPVGQFVLVYYSSPLCGRMLGFTVVEVGHRDPKYKSLFVGDELTPTSGEYDPQKIVSRIDSGLSTAANDPRSPYISQHDTSDWSHKRAGRIFAISPTAGRPNPDSKIQVSWMSKDGLSTLWPFESVFYTVDWNPDSPDFLIPDEGDGEYALPISVPKEYSGFQVCTCQETFQYDCDAGLAVADVQARTIRADRPGWFTAKFATDKDFWYVSFRAIRHDSADVRRRDTRSVAVGTVVRPVVNENQFAGPGYIYLPSSRDADNWNPRLYHADAPSDDLSSYSSLTSVICFVSAPRNAAARTEVWWPYTLKSDLSGRALAAPVDVPSALGRYLAVWPSPDALEKIVVTSETPVLLPKVSGRRTPRVYANNVRGTTGFNPNEEHAYVSSWEDAFALFALRTDLNAYTRTLDPARLTADAIVLVESDAGGIGAITAYRAVLPSDGLASSGVAGTPVAPFLALRTLPGSTNGRNYYLAAGGSTALPAYRDRKNQWWLRRDGQADAYYYYPLQADFWWPETPAGGLVGWMNNSASPAEKPQADKVPLPWRWTARWPENPDTYPTMRLTQVLTRAKNGLAEVFTAKSLSVVYPSVPLDLNGSTENRTVEIIDPTVAQTSSLPLASGESFLTKYGFTVGTGGATARLYKGKYYFMNLPPNVGDRFCVDTTADVSKNMVLTGRLNEPDAGLTYLQLNVLSPVERQALKDICTVGGAAKADWDAAVDGLATDEVRPVRQTVTAIVQGEGAAGGVQWQPTSEYDPQDHYALIATGEGTGWVVTVENDSPDTSMVPEGLPVSMRLFRVVAELNVEKIKVLQDENNQLSERLDMLYATPFGNSATNYLFEWVRHDAPTDDLPGPYWQSAGSGDGLVSLSLGSGSGSRIDVLKSTFYALRYRPKDGTPAARAMIAATGVNDFSAYTEPQLAEGWVQRVLNSVTPFAQRMRDFENYRAELALSMPAQIGGPYEGDVALSNDNLADVGLVQLYQTVLNRAESFSLGADICDAGVNAQLLLAADRLATLYSLLGDEAYSDAKNPTVAVGDGSLLAELKALPTTAFCFAGEVPTLLDEELALLRGRTYSDSINPDNRVPPYYNRLYWNFTKDIAGGEPAYVVNYNIRASEGSLGPDQAAKQYPQGHGDAWGHYLSAVKGYYRLLRNPVFAWGDPETTELLLADHAVTTDYAEEQKLATAAASLVKTGLDVTDLTCRKQARDANGETSGGYFDDKARTYAGTDVTVEQGFGFGEVATKTALAAFYNWATVNSLLPADATNAPSGFADQGLSTVDRGTVTALRTLAAGVRSAETKLNNLDAGLNPLGLSQNAIPFDIDPAQLAQKNAHYDQIRERAERALDNADTLLAYANEFGSRLRAIEDYETDETASEDATEAAYKSRLIGYYGTPFSGDIGPGKTYAQGYDGPDLYNYMMMDLSEYGLSSVVAYSNAFEVVMPNFATRITADVVSIGTSADTVTLHYSLTGDGLVAKTADGVRQCEGRIQAAYRDFLCAYVKVLGAISTYEFTRRTTAVARSAAEAVLSKSDTLCRELIDKYDESAGLQEGACLLDNIALAVERTISTAQSSADAAEKTIPTMQVFGLATSVSFEPAKGGIETALAVAMGALNATLTAYKVSVNVLKCDAALAELDAVKKQVEYDDWDRRKSAVESYLAALESFFNAEGAVETAHAELLAAQQAYRARIAEAQLVVDERTAWRKARANVATRKRYEDMYLRVQRNAALSQYQVAFDAAQRYVWQLARVYDYETGLVSQDARAGAAFLGETIAARSLGKKGTVTCASGAGGGLWDIVKRMDDNWAVLKPRLGVNNPDEETKWFSLRYSLFRIRSDASGDAAWRQELEKCWCDDILSDRDFRRHCERPVSDTVSLTKVPGLIIPFASSVNAGENFFGLTLQGGETAFSSSRYATKLAAAAVSLVGYDALVEQTADGLSLEPEVYLVPVGNDYLRAPIDTGRGRETLRYTVVDQVLPLPHAVGATETWDASWFDAAAKIRRHAGFAVSEEPRVSRLVGRSVWNDRWILVIPATSLNGANPEKALRRLVSGITDIRLGLRAYARQGN